VKEGLQNLIVGDMRSVVQLEKEHRIVEVPNLSSTRDSVSKQNGTNDEQWETGNCDPGPHIKLFCWLTTHP
jgi:hypothetical protein